MEKTKLYKIIIGKKQKLTEVRSGLKAEFIGLDAIIDEVVDLITPWYLFPDAQFRPTIINMWGLTGSGKTALVNRLFELLDHKRLFVQIDMGEFESDSASWIKNTFINDLEFFHEQPGVICFDEFQFARTIDKDGDEIGKDKLRVIWDIMDSGKVNYIPSYNSYYMVRAELCLLGLARCADKGVVIRNGVVNFNEMEFLNVFSDFYFENTTRYDVPVNKNYFLSQDFIDGVFFLFNDADLTRTKIKELLQGAGIDEILRLLTDGLNKRNAVKQLDLSKSLIFILGNLDEAYYMSHSLNPDISADDLHKETCKISITHIKVTLKERFRNEQIARLGNNHIIYRSFTNQNFRDIISQKLEGVKKFVNERFGFEIHFDKSVIDVVYSEGVFPAQGTRPVFTTVKNLIEGSISKLVLEIIGGDVQVSVIDWSCQRENFIFLFKDSTGNILKKHDETLVLKMGELRKPGNIHIQAHTAVHEAGHAILAALTLRIIPSVVVSRTASANSEGFCLVNMPEGPCTRDVLKKSMIIGLGGYVAEKMIFGEDHTSSGVSRDIETVSEMANRAVKEYAMGEDPIYIRLASSQHNLAIPHSTIHTEEALKLIRTCEAEATAILEKNKVLLLKMSEYLTTHSRLEEKEIQDMVCNYSAESWVRGNAFVRKENYFQFANVINDLITNKSKTAIEYIGTEKCNGQNL